MRIDETFGVLIGRGLRAAGARLLPGRRSENVSESSAPVGSDETNAEFVVREGRAVIEHMNAHALVECLRVKLGMPIEVFESAVRPVIERYAEFVQLIPVTGHVKERTESAIFLRTMRTVVRALDYRRCEILPRGASPEAIGAEMHCWTYAVFFAAMLYDIDADLEGMKLLLRCHDAQEVIWDPLSGSMRALGGRSYRVTRAAKRAIDPSPRIALRLEQTLLSDEVRSWLRATPDLVDELQGVLGGDLTTGSGAIAALVVRARFAALPNPPALVLTTACCKTPDTASSNCADARMSEPVDPDRGATDARPRLHRKEQSDHRTRKSPEKLRLSIEPSNVSTDVGRGLSAAMLHEANFLEDFERGHGIDLA